MVPRTNAATRREFLETTAGVAAVTLAGCLGTPPSADPERSPTAPPETGESGSETTPPDDSWPQFGADPRNTGYAPDGTGPGRGEPALAWRYDGGTPTMNTSPVVSEGTVYAPGSGDPGLIHAVDVESGDRVWQFEPEGYASSAPALADGTLYLGTWGKRFYAIDAATGEEVWNNEVGHRFGSSSPVVADGTVYVGTYGDGPLVVSGPEDEAEFEACAFLALDAATGEIVWQYRAFGEKDDIRSSPAVDSGRVYFGGESAVYALDSETGDEVWTRTLSTHSDSSPAVADGVVYYGAPVRGGSGSETPARVWALDASSGETLWTAGVDDESLRTSPAIADGTVYVAASSTRVCYGAGGGESECSGVTRGRLYALDATSGEELWTADIETDTRSSPAVADGLVYVGCHDGLSAVTTDGENAWRMAFESDRDDAPYVKSSPALAEGHVFVGASDGRLRAVTTTRT